MATIPASYRNSAQNLLNTNAEVSIHLYLKELKKGEKEGDGGKRKIDVPWDKRTTVLSSSVITEVVQGWSDWMF